jgi:5-methyltetrahydropteroyltriglutamate--homocysteine methyltransferase
VRYANVLGRENIIAGVDCGFSTVAGTEDFRVDPIIAWAKLAALTHGARIASDQLWG